MFLRDAFIIETIPKINNNLENALICLTKKELNQNLGANSKFTFFMNVFKRK